MQLTHNKSRTMLVIMLIAQWVFNLALLAIIGIVAWSLVEAISVPVLLILVVGFSMTRAKPNVATRL